MGIWIVAALILVGSAWLFVAGGRKLKGLILDHARGDGDLHSDTSREVLTGLIQTALGGVMFFLVGLSVLSQLLPGLLALALLAVVVWAMA